ncbi:MAG: hypothetical protein ABII12_04065 [Planctomycetota bacterium]
MSGPVSTTFRRTFLLAAVAGFCVSAPAGVSAEDPRPQTRFKSQEQREREIRAARGLIADLQLSAQQARRLLSVMSKAAELHVEFYQEEARLLPELIETYGEFAREDSLNQGFTREVERSTAELHREEISTRDKTTAALLKLEDEALAVLTPGQREWVLGFKAKKKYGKDKPPPTDRKRGRRGGKGRDRHFDAPDRGRLAEATEELQDLQQQIHPRPTAVGRFLLHPAAAAELCRLTGTLPNQALRDAAEMVQGGTPEYPASTCDAQKAELRTLRSEISNWNLINGLHLNQQQAEKIVTLYDAAQAEMNASDVKPRQVRRRNAEMRLDLERQVAQVLNPGQQEVLAEFKACLLPPKNLKDPVRVGQAKDNSQFARWLGRARNVRNHRRLAGLADRLIESETKHFGELSEEDRAARVALLMNTAREAAEMSDVEFELSRDDLAEKIAPTDRAQVLKKEIFALSRAEGKPGVVARFILNPQFVDQLRLRGRQLAKGIVIEKTDLAGGPQAENCEDGCAIDSKGKKGAKGEKRQKPRKKAPNDV